MKKINSQELQDLLQGSANKNETKFHQFYETYRSLIYGIAFSILKNNESAEDMVQTVCAKIWEMKPENLPTKKPATWLYTLTKNETLNFLRKQKKTVQLDEIYSVGEEDTNLDGIVEKESYNKILSKLEPQDQEIVSLKVVSGLSFRQISAILNMPIGTVQWKYYKALHTLKMLLANLSMFAVAVIAFVVQKAKKPQRVEKEEKPTEPVTPVQNIIEDSTQESKKETSRDDSENVISESPTVNENQVQENTVQNIVTPDYHEQTGMGTLGLAGVFLFFTIIFAVIYTKHQQNRRKNVSK